MADEFQFGVVVTARQDADAKAQMRTSIEKLIKDSYVKVGVQLTGLYNGKNINQQIDSIVQKTKNRYTTVGVRVVGTYNEKNVSQQITEILSKTEKRSINVDVVASEKSVTKLRGSITEMLRKKNFNPLVTVGLDKGASKTLIKSQLTDIISALATEQTVKLRLSGNQGVPANTQTVVAGSTGNSAESSAAEQRAIALKTQAVAANNQLTTSYNNLMNIEQAVKEHTRALGEENAKFTVKAYDADHQIKTFTVDLTNSQNEIERLRYKLNEAGTGYEFVGSTILATTQADKQLTSAQELLNKQFAQWCALNPKVAASQSGLVSETRTLIAQANQSEEALNRANAAMQKLADTSKTRWAINMDVGRFGSELTNMFTRIGSSLVVTQLYTSIYKVFNAIKDVDSAMVSLKKVTDETARTYDSFLTKASENATKLGMSVSDLVEQTATWAKLGYNLDQASQLAEVSAIYANVGEVDNETSVKDIVTALKAFGISSSDAISVVNELNKLSNEFAVDAAGLGDGLKRAASSMSFTGNSMEQTLALLTGGGEITQDIASLGKQYCPAA